MHKVTKKLWLPSHPAFLTGEAIGGGGGPTSLFNQASFTANDQNPSLAFRVRVPITDSSGTQIRVTLRPGDGGGTSLTILNASIGKWLSIGPAWQTTAVPIELLFGGASGFTTATTDQTSDWANLGGLSFAYGDMAIVCFDTTTGASNSAQRTASAIGVNTYWKDGIQTYNQDNPATMNTISNTNYCVVSVETQ